jgi:deoxyribodipyrimidine photo-lyase
VTLDIQPWLGPVPPEASRAAAHEFLANWRERVHFYAEQRGYVLEDARNVSQLSRYLSPRLILEEEVLADLLTRHPPEALSKFIDEVCWRTYWKGWMEQHPGVWTAYRESLEEGRSSTSGTLASRLAAARDGETGIACFDHWVRELVATGYLHNHARMWFASIWIFTLRLPWALGAEFFLRHLLDGDVASNTLSWRWVGGLHTRGKHYVARAANIARFTEGRFNPAGELNEDPEPLSEPGLHAFIPLRRRESSQASHHPDLSESPAGLLLTAEDLVPEKGILGDAPFHSIGVFLPRELLRQEAYAAAVREFKAGAMRDAAYRAARHWGGTQFRLLEPAELSLPASTGGPQVGKHAPMRIYAGEVDDWAGSVLAWARREHLRAIRVLEPPVGPWRERVDALEPVLRRHGFSLKRYRRRWDELHWPHAAKGYFNFRRGLRERLATYLAGARAD